MKTIGVFFGSRSPEHDVSIITAELVISALRNMDYKVVPVYIGKQGQWHIGQELGKLGFFSAGPYEPKLKQFKEYYLDLEQSVGKCVFVKKQGWKKEQLVVDVAFPALHGSYGEDGTIQGLFEMLAVPYVGCDVASSAVAMDKVLTKQLYKANGLPTTEFVALDKRDGLPNPSKLEEIEKTLHWPLFVKPTHLGSSIGISKAKTRKDLEFGIEVAFHYDDKVIVEQGVEPLMDVTCSVIGHKELQASLLQESVFNDDLFSYEDKYLTEGGAQLGNAKSSIVIPARLGDSTTAQIRDTAIKVFKAFGCSGIARVDFLYNKESKQFYVNEINPMPGTLYHHLWKESGVSLQELIGVLLGAAEQRAEEKSKLTATFDSTILQQANSMKLQLKQK
jgi:D-alanine-D-alanine ligase